MQLQKYHLKTAAQIPQWCCVTASGELANSGTPAHENHVVGVTDGLIESGAWGDVTVSGLLYNLAWSWTPGAALYLNGTALSETPPGAGFTQQIGWALTGQSMIVDVQATGVGGTGPPGPPGPAGPAGPAVPSVIIRDSWDPSAPANPAVDTICVFRDGAAWRTWDATAAAWI